MNSKTKYVLPAFAAIFALMFVAAAPHVLAEPGEGKAWTGYADYKHAKKMHHNHIKVVTVEGFTGSIPVPDMSKVEDKREVYESLKEQVIVKLSDAASAAENAELDVMKGSIDMAVNENNEKYVVWVLVEKNRDSESQTTTATIFVVDAGDLSNTAQVTKEFDHSARGIDTTNFASKAEKLQQKFSEPTGNLEVDALRSQFLEKVQDLRDASYDGDIEKAQQIRDELKSLKDQLIEMRNPVA